MRIVFAGILALFVAGTVAAIDTDFVPFDEIKGQHWDFQFEFKTPRRVVTVDKDGAEHAFWALVYTVTNNDKVARDFQPAATLFTDTGRVAHDNLYPAVVEKVKADFRLDELADSVKMMGPLKAGQDEARDGVFVFPEVDPRMDEFKIFITGLSGEFIVKTIPAAKAGEAPKSIVLRKTLLLVFKFPGDEVDLSADKVHFAGQKWIWR